MRAVLLPRFGGPELFHVEEVEPPIPGGQEVLVRVLASGTNPVDAKIRQDGSWAELDFPAVLGYDAAGVVEEVGDEVADLQPGDEVYFTPPIHGNSRGTYAELTTAPASVVAPKPSGLSFLEAAAVPLAGGTAWEAIMRRLSVKEGETVLIHGAAGGVGSFAVQFAKAAGARVLATASRGNLDFLRDLGADVAIDYESEKPVEVVHDQTQGQGADAVFDIQGDQVVSRSLPALRPFGRIACILPPQGDLTLLYQKNLTLHGIFLTRERERLDEMRPYLEDGRVRPMVAETLPMERVDEAHQRLDSGHGRGKVVLDLRQE